jgi:hypothetical protein
VLTVAGYIVAAAVFLILIVLFETAPRGVECPKHGYSKGKECPWCLDDQTRSD